jgi:hypothetical protein
MKSPAAVGPPRGTWTQVGSYLGSSPLFRRPIGPNMRRHPPVELPLVAVRHDSATSPPYSSWHAFQKAQDFFEQNMELRFGV